MLPLSLKLRALEEAPWADSGEDCYWLLRCRGFSVYDENGRVGTVRRVRFAEPGDCSEDMLVVRTGLFIRKLALIPTSEIDEVSAATRRVTLRRYREPAQRPRRAQLSHLGGAS
jgi:hypothetical protein